MSVSDWVEAIGVTFDENGAPASPDIAMQIRTAVRAAGSLRRGQISRGLNEAYAPLCLEDGLLQSVLEKTLDDLVLIGDLTELKSASGAAYVLTPPRLVLIDQTHATLLGSSSVEGDGQAVSRQLAADDWPPQESTLRVDLRHEIDIPDWRLRLAEIGGVDAPLGTPEALFSHVGRLGAGGERLETLTPDKVRVLSGRQAFFGRYDAAQPEGRWQPASTDGQYCAARQVGHGWRQCVVSLRQGRATVWDAEDADLWRWAVVGQTLSLGDPLSRFDPETGEFAMHVPPPRQVRRLLQLGATATGRWRWRCSASIAALTNDLLSGRLY